MRTIFFAVLLLIAAVGFRIRDRFFQNSLRVTFFDVGQGDAALVEFPFGKTLLIDSGGGFSDRNSGRRVLFPELTRLGILSLDAAVLTHPDLDHGGGFQTLLEEVRAKELWVSDWFRNNPSLLFKSLVAQAAARGTALRFWQHAGRGEWAQARYRISVPAPRSQKDNNRSLVLELEYAGCSFLFLGDLEAEAERHLLSSLTSATVLKVGHHGSRSSTTSELLRRVRPKVAVISVGRENRYGHPASVVLKKLRASQAQIFRTDFHGYVRFIVDNKGKLHCESAQGDCGTLRCSEAHLPFFQ